MDQSKIIELLFTRLSAWGEMSPNIQSDMAGFLEPKSFKKNQVIVAEGEISEYAYYLISGAVRFHHLNSKNEDITTYFYSRK